MPPFFMPLFHTRAFAVTTEREVCGLLFHDAGRIDVSPTAKAEPLPLPYIPAENAR